MTEAEFLEAAKRGDSLAVGTLVRSDPEFVNAADKNGKTGLHWAAEMDHADVAIILMDAGANIEARTSWGASPLDWAANMGSNSVADLLLARGATGLTLIVASALGKLGDVQRIVESGQDLDSHRRRDAPDAPDKDWPPDSAHMQNDILSDSLYAAARNGHREVVSYLLGQGAKIDSKGIFGGTGLHWAAINGHREMAQFLVSHGASLTIKDARFENTPADWAKEGGHDDIAATLRAAP
jgi:ankyrin repeat protein